MSEPTEPWKWGDEGKPQPHNPTNNYPAGTRFLCCGYDGHMAHFSQGNWVRHEDYEMVKSEVKGLTKELADAQESYHLVNERTAIFIKENARLRSVAEDNKRECEATRIENARLKAECQARQAENSVLAVECDSLKSEVERLTAFTTRTIIPNEELQAEVESIRKDRDLMFLEIKKGREAYQRLHHLYLIAKKGVQS